MTQQIQLKRKNTTNTNRPTPANPEAGLDRRTPFGRNLRN